MKNVRRRLKLMKLLTKLIGKNYTARLQSWIKYNQVFRNSYTHNSSSCKLFSLFSRGCNSDKTYVFIIDGKTIHGGISDRLRGAFTIYHYCKANGYKFKILWKSPFMLQDFLQPASVDWIIDEEEMIYDRRLVDFRFSNTYTDMNYDFKSISKFLKSKKPVVHCYSNVSIDEKLYKEYFHELFVPSRILQEAIDRCVENINGDYVSITFRFADLLGDFKDRPDMFAELNSDEKIEYINSCVNAIKRLRAKHPEMKKILVTADSKIFTDKVKDLDYIYVIPGDVVHPDLAHNDTVNLHMKTFLDMIMVSKAKKSYYYTYGRMFASTRFAKTAALLDGREVIKFE